MQTPTLQRQVRAADLPLPRLAANPCVPQAEKVKELSRQFEAVLLRQILRDTQKTVFQSDLKSNDTINSVYQDMIAEQLAEGISKSGTLGLARGLGRQLNRQLTGTPKSTPPDVGSAPSEDLTVIP